MPGGFPQPYRGQPRPKYPKPKKQIINFKAEKRVRILILGISILVMALIFRMLLFLYYASPNNIILSVMIGILILFLLVTFAIADGLKSINKFRKGYDIDVSRESEKKDSKQPENLNDQ